MNMKRLERLLTQADRDAIAAAVARAETRTRAEILPVIAPESGRYDRAEDLFGLALGMAAVLACALAFPAPVDPNSWDTALRAPFGLSATLLILVAVAALGVLLATRVPALVRPFVSRREMQAEVARRAGDCFLNVRRPTHGGARPALLIYASLREHVVYVAADEALRSRLPAGALDRICAAATAGFRAGSPGRAMLDAINTAAEALAAVAPPEPGQVSGLDDALRVVH